MKTTRKHLLVIDDDPTFRATILRLAEKLDLEVTVCSHLGELPVADVPRRFDAVVLDYYLDNMQTSLKGSDVAWALESMPILLMSNQERCLDEDDGSWPLSIRKFVNKKKGAAAILKLAAQMVTP